MVGAKKRQEFRHATEILFLSCEEQERRRDGSRVERGGKCKGEKKGDVRGMCGREKRKREGGGENLPQNSLSLSFSPLLYFILFISKSHFLMIFISAKLLENIKKSRK